MIKVIKGYNFNKVYNVFDNFVNDLYKKKSENTGSIKTISKSLLNNPIGRLGMNINKPKTDLVNKKELDFILSTRNVYSLTEITEDFYLVIYEKRISRDVCLSHG